MNIKDLLIKKEYGFTESFAQEMTSGKNGRLQLFDIDLFDWVNNQCWKKCGIAPPSDIEQGASCEECDCPIAHINLAVIKLGMLEDVLNKIEIAGVITEGEHNE